MAGMKGRSGGARVGAGRKPLSASERWMRGKPAAAVAVAPSTGAVVVADLPMPDDLPAAVAAFWMELAPHALAEATLTPTTAYGFRQLCETAALVAELAADAERRGGSDHRGAMQRLESALARFRLTGDGKPRSVEAAKPVSALADLQARGAQIRRVK